MVKGIISLQKPCLVVADQWLRRALQSWCLGQGWHGRGRGSQQLPSPADEACLEEKSEQKGHVPEVQRAQVQVCKALAGVGRMDRQTDTCQ